MGTLPEVIWEMVVEHEEIHRRTAISLGWTENPAEITKSQGARLRKRQERVLLT